MKKYVLLTIAFLTLNAIAAFAQSFTIDGFQYNVLSETDKTVEVLCTYYPIGELTIPDTIRYNGTIYSVTSIGKGAFYYCGDLTSITIPISITSIKEDAFYGCVGLTAVIWNAKNCADFLYSDDSPFYNSSLYITSFTFGDSVQHIPAYLCYGLSQLTSVTIPKATISIVGNSFSRCSGLTSITVEEGNPIYITQGNCIINSRTKQLITGCNNSIIPTDGSVKTIGRSAFEGCSGLTSITIPSSITTIGEDAFYLCGGLLQTNYTGDIASWCAITFENYQANPSHQSHNLYLNDVEIKDAIIPDGVDEIGDYAFYSCSALTSVSISNSVTAIGASAFSGCSALEKVNYAGTLQSWCTISMGSNPLNNGADFYLNDVKVTEVTIINNQGHHFEGCTSLQTITINTNGCIGYFKNCTNLQNVTINGSPWGIGTDAFKNCTSLQEIILPKSVGTIYNGAFEGCTSLTSATIKSTTPPSVGTTAFPSNTKIIVPCGSSETYWADPEWAKYLNFEEAFLIDWSVVSEDEEHGTVLISKSPTTCGDNTATFAAIPAFGYKFKAWNDGNTDNPRTVAITEEITYTAHFINENNVDGISLDATQLNLHAGETHQLTATITPTTAVNKNVTWSSTNPSVASVSKTGLVTAHDSGTTTITVTTADGGFTASCEVYVSVPVESITFDQTALTLVPNKAQQLTATILPENASNKNFTWQSSNENVAIVVKNGLVVALAEGATTITAITEDGGLTATCAVTVTTVSGILLDKTSLELSVGDLTQLTETIIATEASYQLVNWATSDANVATVENGLVTAVGAGVAAIGVATVDGGFVATCALVVKDSGTTEVQQVQANPSGVQKVLVDGVLYIVKPNGEKYLVDGRKVE